MSTYEEAQERDMILFVGSYLDSQRDDLQSLSNQLGKKIKACVIVDVVKHDTYTSIAKDPKAIVLVCDLTSRDAIEKTLLPYKHRFLAVTCRAERNVLMFKTIIPHVPYLHTPTETSLDWTTDKLKMRQRLRTYDKTISPKFLVVKDASEATLEQIERTVGYPLVLKPAGLAKSLLVTLCYHREELEENLDYMIKKINLVYKKNRGRGEPQILVEEFMDGVMYSIDCYVNHRGIIYYTPLVHVKTGRSIGFDDFFGYIQITPVQLKQHKIDDARKTAEKAIEAMGLRSTSCHIELMKTEEGWKVIELGSRLGGFRHEMYNLSFGINHSLNDILIRIPKKPKLPKRIKGYTAIVRFYPKNKGRLQSLEGVNKARKLESFKRIAIMKQIGDMCDFAKNGDDPVFDIVLFNQNRPRLLADIRRLEQAIKIKTKKPAVRKTAT